jgi:hypothetical protein
MFEDNKKGEKRREKYCCDLCDYFTSDKTKYNLHLLTIKHKNTLEDNKKERKGELLKKSFVCHCGNSYVFQSGLTKHKKKCASLGELQLASQCIQETRKLIEENRSLLKEINDLKNQSQTTINQTFNKQTINVFLNEKCKNAMSISSFIETINPTLEDLEYVGEKGYVKGLSSIILTKLRELDIYTRPIHNLKKEIYIKEQDWENDHGKVVKFVKNVAMKNMKNISVWKLKNPDHENIKSGKNSQFLKIIKECNGEEEKTHKIIQNISKEIDI